MIDVAELNILPPIDEDAAHVVDANAALVEPPKPTHIAVFSEQGEDLIQYFEKNFVGVERILSTTVVFPVIHPR